MADKTTYETKDCTGCRSCELACSYHHTGTFSPATSSIQINGLDKIPFLTMSFNKQENNGHLPCDGCNGLAEPLCVKYCNMIARDELRRYLGEFLSFSEQS